MRLKMKRKEMPAALSLKFKVGTQISMLLIVFLLAAGIGLYLELKRAHILDDVSFKPSLAGVTLVKG